MIATTLLHTYNLKLIPYRIWVEEVERSAVRSPEVLTPAAKMLQFFKGINTDGGAGREVLGLPTLSTAESVRVSPALASLKESPIREEDMMRWLRYWASQGVIPFPG